MLEQRVRTLSETLARTLNRRSFLQRTASTLASGVTAVALGSLISNSTAQADSILNGKSPLAPNCTPPGPYCNLDGNFRDPNGCHGSQCFQHLYAGKVRFCHVFYQFWAAGCWTYTPPTGDGHWTCCDCRCDNNTMCGCAQYSTIPYILAE